MRVLGFGEASIDYVYVVPQLPDDRVSKLRISESFVSVGGQVATTMAACSALGLEAGYLGALGDDENAARIADELTSSGVDVSRAIRQNARSRFAVILVDEKSGERSVLFSRDDRLNVEPASISPSLIAGAYVLHVDATDCAAALRLSELAREARILVTTDVDTVTSETAALLLAATVPIVAEHVPRELTGTDDLASALRQMRQPHQPLVIATLGARGAAAFDGVSVEEMPACSVTVVDTTSAGDVFRAGVIRGLLHQWTTPQVLRFANAAAALACTRAGALASVPSLNVVERTLAGSG